MHSQITDDLKNAQLAKDETATMVLRMLLSEIKYAEISKGAELGEADHIAVIQKELKKRREAAAGFRQGGREEQALKEEAEAKILEKYLPTQLSDEELTKIVEEAITETGASTMQDMGRVIGMVMGKVAGQAEGARISNLVKEKLVGNP